MHWRTRGDRAAAGRREYAPHDGPVRRLMAAGTIAVLVSGSGACSRAAPDAPALADAPVAAAVSSPGDTVRVTGTAPTARDGSLTVVVLEPQAGPPVEPPETPVQMDQLGMEFLPPVLLAIVGQPVNFTNSEDVLHNVRVYNIDTKETAFNISTPIGGTYVHRFETAGTYRVACDIHPAMGASVVVTMSPYSTVARRDGSFAIDDVAPGAYMAFVQAGAQRRRHAVTITSDDTDLSLGSD